MLRQIIPPIHPDGWKFVALAAVVTLLLFLVWTPVGWLGVLATLWIAIFFRDPWRVTPTRPGLIVSPADGLIVSISQVSPPPELGLDPAPMTRIGIFLNLLDVHIARSPAAGRIAAMRYTAGRFINASLDKASEHNERLAIRLTPAEGPPIPFVLIAGLVARRIVPQIREGQLVGPGERIGLIRFGSRVDVYCPAPYVPLVALGQRTVGGETVLADLRAQEPPRTGIEH